MNSGSSPGSAPRVLVTGGSGFIGTNLVDRYLRQGAEVLSIDVSAPRNRPHEELWTRVDLRDRAAVTSAVRDFAPTLVFHLGARTDLVGRDDAAYDANCAGVSNVVAALTASGTVERAIFASSRMVCRIGYQPTSEEDYCPNTLYGESKVEGERRVRSEAHQLPWIIVRPTSIWGPWFDVPYRAFFVSVARGRYLHPRGRRILKSFGYVGNTVHQLVALAASDASVTVGRTFYLADYPPLDVADWAASIRRQVDGGTVRSIPVPLLRAGAIAGDIARRAGWSEPPLTTFRLTNLLTQMVYDLGPLQDVVGDRLPYDLGTGVAATVAWLRKSQLL